MLLGNMCKIVTYYFKDYSNPIKDKPKQCKAVEKDS